MTIEDNLKTGVFFEVAIIPSALMSLTLDELKRGLRSARVEARGWSFPHYNDRSLIIGPDGIYVGNETEYQTYVSHLERWRFYRSGQVLSKRRPWEAADSEWQAKTRSSLEVRGKKLSEAVIGFLSFELLLFNITEAYLFASRLAAAVPYESSITIRVGLANALGYALASSEPSRPLYEPYLCPLVHPHTVNQLPVADLIANPKTIAAIAATNLFQQFRWADSPTTETLAQYQRQYY